MMDNFIFDAQDYSIAVSFRTPRDAPNSVGGIVDCYAAFFPIQPATQALHKRALYKKAAGQLNKFFRFAAGTLHSPPKKGELMTVDFWYKSYHADFCIFKVMMLFHELRDGKHTVTLDVDDDVTNGRLKEHWQKTARNLKKRKA